MITINKEGLSVHQQAMVLYPGFNQSIQRIQYMVKNGVTQTEAQAVEQQDREMWARLVRNIAAEDTEAH